MDANCGYDCFDLPITEVLQNQHRVSWVYYVHKVANIYYQDRIYPLIKSKHSLESVTKLITENCIILLVIVINMFSNHEG